MEIQLGAEPAIVACTPDLTRQVLVDDRTFDKGGPLFERGMEIAGDNLVTCPHSTHRAKRRAAQPAFHHSRMPEYARVMSRQVVARTDTWRDGQVIGVLAETMILSSETLIRTLLADSLQPGEIRALHDDLAVILSNLLRQVILPPVVRRLPGSGHGRFRAASAHARRTIAEAIARPSSGDRGALLAALASGGPARGDAELNNMLVAFFLAGTETTATTLAWCLYLVDNHKAAGARLRAEAETVLAGRAPSFDDLPNLRYTQRFLTEVLRLYPPTWLLTRRTSKPTTLANHPIPSGTTIVCSPYLIHHRPDLYPAPERFDPDRPTPERDTYLPFGDGARRCIGDRFGTAELVLALSGICAGWTLETVRPPTTKVSMIIRPHGLRMRVHAL
ncbi:cytochrome P450 [Pseudonocardia eucalypti]|uniref:Cytochrome P450 n=1 Tax=Pseudonocardia eucalypti TaxID=648755 RepID=A0ABP9RC61_9PSEU|nr:pentalenene oxygenase [Pseudonocardia eucalypti]